MKPNTQMHRVPKAELPLDLQASWEDALDRHGDTTFVEVMGNNPDLLRWYKEEFYEKIFYGGVVPIRSAELLRLRLAEVHGCAFCVRNDTKAALDAGITMEQIEGLANFETGPFSEADKAVLALADQMVLTNTYGSLDATLHLRLQSHFTEAAIVQFGVIAAMLCGMAKFLFVFDLVERLETCPFTPA